MGFFDDIVPADTPSSGAYRLPRITVRPKGVEPPSAPENAAPVRSGGLFDDIVPPARPENTLQPPASDETDNAAPARSGGLFDDIVPPAPQAAPTEADIPHYDPMTGMLMPAPQLAPQSPGLPVRPETQAPLKTPPSSWSDLPVRVPRADVALAVPDPTALGEGFPAPPGPSAMDRIRAAVARGFGDEPLGFSEENRAKYPQTYRTWQPVAAPLDLARRAPGAAIGAISSAGAETYKALGGTETDANRLERDLNILGQSAMVDGGIGGRYNIGKPQANLFRTTEGALSDEAGAAPRGTIGPMVQPLTPRQGVAEASGQDVPTPRAGPQPPARPPDRAAAQSEGMTLEARESGPSSLEDKEQGALGLAGPEQKRAEALQGLSAGPRITDISKYPPKQGEIFTDLGPHTFQPGETPLGQAAQEYVLANGREHKREFLLAFDSQGKTIAHGYGAERKVEIPDELLQKMMDPGEAVVLHHNHPGNAALSAPDISLLAYPGNHAIWAHSDGGAVSRGSLTEAARKAVAADPVGGVGQISVLAEEARKRVGGVVRRAVEDGRVSAHEARGMTGHLANVIMHDAGIINYASNFDATPLIAKLNLAAYLERVTATIRSKFYGNKTVIRNDRPAGRPRHPGDLGATFARPDAPATKHNAAGPDDP